MADRIANGEFFAFPFSYRAPSEDGEPLVIRACHGMNLRDWFAGQALSGLVEAYAFDLTRRNPTDMADAIAVAAIAVADAILEARNEDVG